MLRHQALTSLWLPASLDRAVVDALLHCFVIRTHFSHIKFGRLTLLRRHQEALGCSIRDARPVEICLPGSQHKFERFLSLDISGTHPLGARSADLASATP